MINDIEAYRAMRRAVFHERLRQKFGDMILIAEVKTESKLTGWKSLASWQCLLEFAVVHGHWISIHADSRWDGSYERVRKARRCIDMLPPPLRPQLLAKGIHERDEDK
jgi:indole-3-glycerol phosphate synthase